MSISELKPESKGADEPARRIEVFTGQGRWRAWSADEKAAVVAESLGGTESVCNVARRHGLTPQQRFTGAATCASRRWHAKRQRKGRPRARRADGSWKPSSPPSAPPFADHGPGARSAPPLISRLGNPVTSRWRRV